MHERADYGKGLAANLFQYMYLDCCDANLNNDVDYPSNLWNPYSSTCWIGNGPKQNEQDAIECVNELESLHLDA